MAASFTRQAIPLIMLSRWCSSVLQAPLFLPLFALIPPPMFSLATAILYILTDLLCAEFIVQIADSGVARVNRLFSSPRKDNHWDSLAVGAANMPSPPDQRLLQLCHPLRHSQCCQSKAFPVNARPHLGCILVPLSRPPATTPDPAGL
ncbi:MAG: hypothetical protein Q9198_009311 [Flavoplaca austrocitrina]